MVLIRLVGFYVLGWFLSRHLTRFSISLAHRLDIVARPNDRTSHEGAIPRIGGVGIAVPCLLVWAAMGLLRFFGPHGASGGEAAAAVGSLASFAPEPRLLWALLVGGCGAFALGLWDDARALPPVVKLVGQVVIAAVPWMFGLGIVHASLPGVGWWPLPPIAAGLLGLVWVLFWMNAFNFMDGINGLAGRFGEILGFSMVVLAFGVTRSDPLMIALFAGCCTGFLGWNAPEARTFMGDCGSLFVGYVTAVWMLYLPDATQTFWINTQTGKSVPERAYPFPAMLVLSLPFTWDVIYTLIRRLTRGENLLQAHRSHLYQRLLKTGRNHTEVLGRCMIDFYICALCAVVYARFSSPRDVILRWAMIVIPVAALLTYSIQVLRREQKASANPPSL